MAVKESFERRFKEILGEKEYERFIEINDKPLRKSIRINSLKVSEKDKIVDGIGKKGFKLKPVPWSDYGYFVEYNEERYDLGNLFEHFAGEIYVQEASSMLPPLAMDLEKVKKGDSILDMAAAPGSKSSEIVELTGDKCVVVANDSDFRRLAPLKANLERVGARNIMITNSDASSLESEEKFSRILLDAPCSGSGVIRKSPNTLKMYNPGKLKKMQNLQFKLFSNAVRLLEEGGVLVYSTCSLDPEEDELLVKRVLENFDNIELKEVCVKDINTKTPVKKFEGKEIPEEITSKVLRVWPQDYDTSGFFVAKFIKKTPDNS